MKQILLTNLLVFFLIGAYGTEKAFAAATFTLTLAPASISFADQDPDSFPSTTGNSTVSISINGNGLGSNAPWSLHALSAGDLNSAANSIPISSISWTATNHPTFYDGSFSTAVPGVLVASGVNTGNFSTSSTLTFSIQNLWTYATGNYSQTTNFTVSSP